MSENKINMKTSPVLHHFLIALLFVGVMVSCSTDRLSPIESNQNTGIVIGLPLPTPPPAKDTIPDIKTKVFLNGNSGLGLEKLEPLRRKITVNSNTDLPIIGPKGTKLYFNNYTLVKPNGAGVNYPFDVEIIELYTFKDMLLYSKPTTSFDKILVTAGSFYVNVTQGNETLRPNPNFYPEIQVPSAKALDTQMKIFYEGYDAAERATWVVSDSTQGPQVANPGPTKEREGITFFGKGYYSLFPSKFGWINCDKFYNYSGEKTQVKFASEYPDLKNMLVFMIFPKINSIIQVYEGLSLAVPVGEEVKLVVVGKTEKEEYYSFYEEFKVAPNQTRKILLAPTTEKEFYALLEKL